MFSGGEEEEEGSDLERSNWGVPRPVVTSHDQWCGTEPYPFPRVFPPRQLPLSQALRCSAFQLCLDLYSHVSVAYGNFCCSAPSLEKMRYQPGFGGRNQPLQGLFSLNLSPAPQGRQVRMATDTSSCRAVVLFCACNICAALDLMIAHPSIHCDQKWVVTHPPLGFIHLFYCLQP